MADFKSLKKTLDEIKDDLRNKATNERIDELLAQVAQKDKKVDELEARVSALEGEISIQKTLNLRLERLIDDHEQYGRRTSLRITGISKTSPNETAHDCKSAVQEEIKKLGVTLDENCIDRAHRVGKPKEDAHGLEAPRAIIVKFKSWNSRTTVYKNRPKWNGPGGGIRFHVDLTKRRLSLKNRAIAMTNGVEAVDFVFADINCNTCLRLKNGEFKFFNSEEELLSILGRLP